MNDVNPPRSIRNVPVSARRRSPGDDQAHSHDSYETGGYRIPPSSIPPQQLPRRGYWGWFVVTVVLCGALGAGLSLFFSSATIKVVPRTASVDSMSPITFSVASDSSNASTTSYFEELTLTASTSRTVSASGTKDVTTAARGTVTIYNKYSTDPQPLVATTRFESPTGKIYRIHENVTVPGGKKRADGAIEPGSVSAVVYADKPGAEYNAGKTQFSIPGFKDTPRYNGFYAATDGIGGGSSGPQPVVTSADAEKATAEMQAELKNSLTSRLAGSVPQGFVLVPDAVDISYGEPSSGVAAGSGKATLSDSATLTAPVIKVSDLAAALAAGVEGYRNEPVGIQSPAELPIAVDKQYTAGSSSITLTLTGPVTLLWQVDKDAIAGALAGKPKSQFDGIMTQFKPSVASATIYLRPIWLTSFPRNPDKIQVELVPDK